MSRSLNVKREQVNNWGANGVPERGRHRGEVLSAK